MSQARRLLRAGLRAAWWAVGFVASGVMITVLVVSTDAAVAQVPTTIPTSTPTTKPPPPTSSPPTTSRPTTTQKPPPTTRPPEQDEDDQQERTATSDPGAPTSARPPATGAGGGQEEVPAPDPNLPEAVQLGEEEDALITSSASGKLPAIFPWLAFVGTFVFLALLAAQWALTNPARRGSRTL